MKWLLVSLLVLSILFTILISGCTQVNVEERNRTRPVDICGDGVCGYSETCSSCDSDCGLCQVCGDELCIGSEDCGNCEKDCGKCETESYCGNGVCDDNENFTACTSDCGTPEIPPEPVCGDGACDAGESCNNCEIDCGVCEIVCGDEYCVDGEDIINCPDDCVLSEPQNETSCGDGICNGTETIETCEQDCFQEAAFSEQILFDFHLGLAESDPYLFSDHELIDIVSLIVSWPEIEPEQGNFNFSYLDNLISIWSDAGKKIWLRFSTYGQSQGNTVTPEWVKESVPVIEFERKGFNVSIPVVWGEEFFPLYESFINKMAERYGNDSRVEFIQAGVGHIGYLTAQPSSDGKIAFLDAGWTIDIWKNYSMRVVDMYSEAFNEKKIFITFTPRFLRDHELLDHIEEAKDIATYAESRGVYFTIKGFDPDPMFFEDQGIDQLVEHMVSLGNENLVIGFGDDFPFIGPTGGGNRTVEDFQSILNNLLNLWNENSNGYSLFLVVLDNSLSATEIGNEEYNETVYNILTDFIGQIS